MKLSKSFRRQVFEVRHLPRDEAYCLLVADNPTFSPKWIRHTANAYLNYFKNDKRTPPTIPALMKSYACNSTDAENIQHALMSK